MTLIPILLFTIRAIRCKNGCNSSFDVWLLTALQPPAFFLHFSLIAGCTEKKVWKLCYWTLLGDSIHTVPCPHTGTLLSTYTPTTIKTWACLFPDSLRPFHTYLIRTYCAWEAVLPWQRCSTFGTVCRCWTVAAHWGPRLLVFMDLS